MPPACPSRQKALGSAGFIAAAVAVLIGCSGATRPPPSAPVNLAGFPPAFRDGYAAGCDSAKTRITRRDEARFKTDRQYASGWRDGFDICSRKTRSAQ